jgi:hypothetical protein
MSAVETAVLLYAAGAAVALWRTDGPWPIRIVLALLWPIGPTAFAVTVGLLLGASLIAFPAVGIAVGAGVLAWWMLA